MNSENDEVAALQRRFALRLDAALTAIGYPVLTAGRARALANALGIDISVATALMSGHYLPDYPQLLGVCKIAQRQPGFFLDEQVLDVPPGTIVVKPIGIGEDLVLRLPSEVLPEHEARKGLRYWRTTIRLGFGIGAGEYLIALDAAKQSSAEPNKLYLLSSNDDIDVVRCAEVHANRAVFRTDAADDIAHIVLLGKRGKRLGKFGKLVASIRAGSSLHAIA